MPEPDPPFASVVVPVRDGEETVAECVRSLLAQDYPASRREVVVVDNGSSDRTAALVRAAPVRYVYEPSVGRSHARNRGIAETRGEIVAFVDADCVAAPGWLRALVAPFAEPDVGAVGGEVLALEPATRPERFMARREPRWQAAALANRERPFLVTANVAFRREAFRRIGLFDPELVTAEDVDLSWRFLDGAGLEARYAPAAIVHHRHRPTLRELARQQYWLGYGRVLLRHRHGLPHGARWEAARWRRLGEAVLALGGTAGRLAVRRAERLDVYCAACEVGVQLVVRLGALHWRLARRRPGPVPRARPRPHAR